MKARWRPGVSCGGDFVGCDTVAVKQSWSARGRRRTGRTSDARIFAQQDAHQHGAGQGEEADLDERIGSNRADAELRPSRPFRQSRQFRHHGFEGVMQLRHDVRALADRSAHPLDRVGANVSHRRRYGECSVSCADAV